jgi:hypothetical protein
MELGLLKAGEITTPISRPEFARSGIMAKIGAMRRADLPKEVSQFFTEYNRTQDAYRKFITGAQAGFPEISTFIPSALPNPGKDTKENFLANIEQFESSLARGIKDAKDFMVAEGYTPEQIQTVIGPAEEFLSGQGSAQSLTTEEASLLDDLLGTLK